METTVELNITAFLNLMVILVPFLLITAVFSRMTILELNLPALNSKADENTELKLQLQVVVTQDQFVIRDLNLGEFRRVARMENGVEVSDPERKIWKPFTDTLITLKARFPDEQNIALLLDREVSYKSMIAVMDRVRSADIVQVASLETVELFPLISIGDIPLEQTETTVEGRR